VTAQAAPTSFGTGTMTEQGPVLPASIFGLYLILVVNYSAWSTGEGRQAAVHPHCRQVGQELAAPRPSL
jgi:hypothetical protein